MGRVTLSKPKTPRQKAKDKAWSAFSTFIRTRDCIRFKDSLYDGVCITCKRDYPFKQLQAGHFIQGRGNSVLFDERLVYSQCFGCNGNPPYGKGGNYVEYTLFMMNFEGYTKEEIEAFNNLKFVEKVYKEYDFVDLRALYIQKTKDLVSEFKLTH